MTITSITLTNPGGESGSTTGWTQRTGTGGFQVFTVAPGSGVTPHSGSYFFYTGDGPNNNKPSFDQEIDVSAYATAIDANTASVRAAAYQCTRNDIFRDSGEIYIQCLDSGGSVLKTAVSSNLTPFVWTQQQVDCSLPANTRKVRIGAVATTSTAGNAEVYIDDFTAEISDLRDADYPGIYALHATQAGAYAWGTYQSAYTGLTQGAIYAFGASQISSGLYRALASQLGAYAWVRASPRRRRMQAWTFSLDGHDFYVLELAGEGTVVYDLATGQWAEWKTTGLDVWRARIGANWLGMGKTTADRLYGTNVVCGDNTLGILWMLDPNQGYDDPTSGSTPDSFTRYVTGYNTIRMRETQSNAGVYVTLNLGAPSITGAQITLRTSDDNGHSYYDHGSIVITADDYTQEVAWRGLGLMRSPGRLFELTDNGAAVRIAAADAK